MWQKQESGRKHFWSASSVGLVPITSLRPASSRNEEPPKTKIKGRFVFWSLAQYFAHYLSMFLNGYFYFTQRFECPLGFKDMQVHFNDGDSKMEFGNVDWTRFDCQEKERTWAWKSHYFDSLYLIWEQSFYLFFLVSSFCSFNSSYLSSFILMLSFVLFLCLFLLSII